MADLNETFGRVLAARRRAAGLSQETLAFDCDLHPTYISQIERGLKSPTIRTLFLIAKALGVPPSAVLREVEKSLKSGGSAGTPNADSRKTLKVAEKPVIIGARAPASRRLRGKDMAR